MAAVVILIDLDPALRHELVATLTAGVSYRIALGHPPSNDLAALVRQLHRHESPGVAGSRQPSANGEENPDNGQAMRLLNRREAAERLSVSVSTLDRLPRESLPAVKVGRRKLFRPEDIAAYIERTTCR